MLLQFARLPGGEAIKVLFVTLRPGEGSQVWIEPDWARKVDDEDQAYLNNLLGELEEADASNLPNLCDELCRQSRGPLTVEDQGELTGTAYSQLVEGLVRIAATL
jgi:hypothetical protein